jgi:hypothetical protein
MLTQTSSMGIEMLQKGYQFASRKCVSASEAKIYIKWKITSALQGWQTAKESTDACACERYKHLHALLFLKTKREECRGANQSSRIRRDTARAIIRYIKTSRSRMPFEDFFILFNITKFFFHHELIKCNMCQKMRG